MALLKGAGCFSYFAMFLFWCVLFVWETGTYSRQRCFFVCFLHIIILFFLEWGSMCCKGLWFWSKVLIGAEICFLVLFGMFWLIC